MVKDAEINAEKGKARRALVEAQNHAEYLIHTTEKTMAEAGEKVPAPDKTAAEQAIAALQTAHAGDDLQAIKAHTKAPPEAHTKHGPCRYQQAERADQRVVGK